MIDKELLRKHQIRPARPPATGEPRTYREKLLTDFLDKINQARKADGFPALSYGRLAKLVEGWNEVQLKCLYDDCSGEHVRSFSALFWSKVQPKKNGQRFSN